MEDMDEDVRQAAFRAVTYNISKDNDIAVRALVTQLAHCYFWVSAAAAKALKEISVKEIEIVNILLSRLGDENMAVNQQAVELILRIAPKGDSCIIQGIANYLQSTDAGVRHLVMEVLKKIGKGDDVTIKAVIFLLQQPEIHVKRSALKALEFLANKGNEMVLEVVDQHLKHNNVEVRLAALSAISKLANQNNPLAIEGLCHCLSDTDTKLQKLAAASLTKLVDKGNPHAVRMLCGLVDAPGDHTLRTLVPLLSEVAGCSRESLELVSSMLQRQSKMVRSAVFEEVTQIKDTDYKQCTFTICACWDPECTGADKASSLQECVQHGGAACDETTDLQTVGVRIAAQALSSCLLHPGTPFPVALAEALKTANGRRSCGSRPVRVMPGILDTCMKHDCWPIRWDVIEQLCRASATVVNDSVSAMVTFKRKARKPDRDTSVVACLHRRDCPHLDESTKPPKRARRGGG
jgi:HEAT repeat protein